MLTESKLESKVKYQVELTRFWMGRFMQLKSTESRRDATYSLGKLASLMDIQREFFPNSRQESVITSSQMLKWYGALE